MISPPTSVRRAFDRHAPTYDERFSLRPTAEQIRGQIWQLADASFHSAARILDLGCGTGEDAIHFARRGVRVTAVDISTEMLARLASKVSRVGLVHMVECVHSEMHQYTPQGSDRFDGILSNFSALNCLSDLHWLRKLAEDTLTPGSSLVLTTLGRFYPLETIVHFLKGNPQRAMRRLHSPSVAIVEGIRVDVYYHSVRSIRKTLGPRFHLEQLVGLCSLSPAPGWEHLQRSRLLGLISPLDRLLCRFRWTATFADHFVSVWRYR